MKKIRMMLVCLLLCLALMCTACSTNAWLKGEWILASVKTAEGKMITPEEFYSNAFAFGSSVSDAEITRIAQQITHITKLSLNMDGNGTVEYMNPFGKNKESCTWNEEDGVLKIIFKGRVQFTLQCDRRTDSLSDELKESRRLSETTVMSIVRYTLKYKKQ